MIALEIIAELIRILALTSAAMVLTVALLILLVFMVIGR
jgi:hypothetical protein